VRRCTSSPIDTLSCADNEMSDRQTVTLYVLEYILALLSKLLGPRYSFYGPGRVLLVYKLWVASKSGYFTI